MAQRLLISFVKAYRLMLSPWLGSACRFEPTCSLYALAALEQHGAAAGSYLTIRRLARCQPWCVGGHDPVPSKAPPFLSRLISPPKAAANCASAVNSPSNITEKKSS